MDPEPYADLTSVRKSIKPYLSNDLGLQWYAIRPRLAETAATTAQHVWLERWTWLVMLQPVDAHAIGLNVLALNTHSSTKTTSS
jgi:hypothetical protein